MGHLRSFTHVSVDGFFAGPRGEADWFKEAAQDSDYQAWAHAQARTNAPETSGTLVYGRTTYEMMKSWWPTKKAIEMDPAMAKVVNESPKLVFSRELKETPEEPHWKNITLVHDIDAKDIRERKERARGGLTVLGSGSIVQQLSNLGLIDEYTLVVVPIVLGEGKPLFDDVQTKKLKLLETKSFPSGLTVMRYEPKAGS